jgi:hypothetical protein
MLALVLERMPRLDGGVFLTCGLPCGRVVRGVSAPASLRERFVRVRPVGGYFVLDV